MSDSLDYYDVQAMIRDARSEIHGEIANAVREAKREIWADVQEAINDLNEQIGAERVDRQDAIEALRRP